jgi:hypothetical protein
MTSFPATEKSIFARHCINAKVHTRAIKQATKVNGKSAISSELGGRKKQLTILPLPSQKVSGSPSDHYKAKCEKKGAADYGDISSPKCPLVFPGSLGRGGDVVHN